MARKPASPRSLKRLGPAWVDDAAFAQVSEAAYGSMVRQAAADLLAPEVSLPFESPHERAFVVWAVLAMSPLGGCCWPQAGRDLCRLTWEQAAHLGDPDHALTGYLLFPRKGLAYPVFVAPLVQLATLLLIVQRMRVKPMRNRALAPLQAQDHLGPDSHRVQSEWPEAQVGYRLRLIQRYLENLRTRVGLNEPLCLESYLAMGRYTLSLAYDLDVLYATLGGFDTVIAQPGQLTSPEFWAAMQQPLQSFP